MSGVGARQLRVLSDLERFDWLRLARCDGVGPRTFSFLLNKFGTAKAALDALPKLHRRPARIPSPAEIERECEQARRIGARFVALDEPTYPTLLRRIDTAPPVLAIRGNAAVFDKPAVAIVGSRNASAAGLAFAERLARGLAQHDYAIVSGLARGIDIRAHRSSGETGTVAVLAGGFNRVYPPEFAPLLERFLEQGAVVSEMPLDWEARGRDFPRRNRIVAGLAQGTVVVEAARRSGSLITARFAAEQGREVFAVPGSPLDPRAEGTNDLLREGATLCTSVEDILEALSKQIEKLEATADLFTGPRAEDSAGEMFWDELEWSEIEQVSAPSSTPTRYVSSPKRSDRAAVPSAAENLPMQAEPEPKTRILGLLGPSPIAVDELVRCSAIPAGEVRSILLELELAGRLERQGGDLVALIRGAGAS